MARKLEQRLRSATSNHQRQLAGGLNLHQGLGAVGIVYTGCGLHPVARSNFLLFG